MVHEQLLLERWMQLCAGVASLPSACSAMAKTSTLQVRIKPKLAKPIAGSSRECGCAIVHRCGRTCEIIRPSRFTSRNAKKKALISPVVEMFLSTVEKFSAVVETRPVK
jgi:hypothetical protein